MRQVTLATPRGFCAGVDRAIEIVNRALEVLGAPIYVRHEVVHNRFVVNDLRDKGAIFVQELDEVPDNATVIFSAHGVSRAVQDEALRRGLKVFDATCPLVTKVHMEVLRYSKEGRETILIGHKITQKWKARWGNMIPVLAGRFIGWIHLLRWTRWRCVIRVSWRMSRKLLYRWMIPRL